MAYLKMSHKKIIKLNSSQAQLMVLQSLKTTMSKPAICSTISRDNTSLPSQQKACGLFNQIKRQENNDADGNGILDDFINTNVDQKNEKSKTFLNESLLLEDINNAAEKNNSFYGDELENSVDLENQNLVDFLSPTSSRKLEECLKEMSPFDLNLTDDSKLESKQSKSDFLAFGADTQTQEDIQEQYQEIINNDPFLCGLDFNLNSDQDANNPAQYIVVEHLYASKRHLEEDQVEVTCEESEKSKKKQRTKGIYRAKDVKSEQDLLNYIERRQKNNKSSKISRSNKKSIYNQMDQKSDQLEVDNQMLKDKIEKLQTNISLLKTYLISNMNSS